MLHPYTDLKTHLDVGPLVITRGEGVRVFDEAGRGYIDSVAGLWCASLGFSNERLVQAAATQMRKLPFYHSFGAKSHEPMIDLAEMLIERAPVPMSKVFFANSGSRGQRHRHQDGLVLQQRVGRPNKKKIIGRIKGYHGITLAAASLTGLAANHRSFDVPLPGFLHTMTPHHYHGAHPGESEEEFATRCAEELEKLILAEGPDTVAAMWAEPVLGAGGVIVPPATYYEKIQAVLRRYDVLFVADEVICGFWRTGNYWGSQTLNMQPDILTCAKALSSSYLPISAVMVNERVFQALAEESHIIGTFGHGYTYSGHPVPAAVAVETLKIYDEIKIGEHVRSVGPHLQGELRRRFAGHELVGESSRRRVDRRHGAGGRQGNAPEFPARAQDRAAPGQAARATWGHRPGAVRRRAGVQPAVDHHPGRNRRDARRCGPCARRADGAAAPREYLGGFLGQRKEDRGSALDPFQAEP